MLESPSKCHLQGRADYLQGRADYLHGRADYLQGRAEGLQGKPLAAGQALFLKAQVEGWRANNIFGLLLWQFNEVWPTGGWGARTIGFPS